MKLLIVLAVYAVGITVGYLLGFLKSIYTYERGATEQKAEYDSQLPLIKETYYNAGYETAKNKMMNKAVAWVDHNVGTLSAMALRKAMEG